MPTARSGPAILLKNGKVLVAGGTGSDFSPLATAEIYDPATGTWSATGSMATPRAGAAVLLSDGRVLVAGGYDGTNMVASAEVFDPATGTWSATGSMAAARSCSLVLLGDGRVLALGGMGNSFNAYQASAEIYDPASGKWSATGSLATARSAPAVLLKNGKVLVAGGMSSNGNYLATAEIYDPATGSWGGTGSRAAAGSAALALLQDGRVLAAGGGNAEGGVTANAEIYDPAAGTWSATGSLAAARWAGIVLLNDGRAMVAGGQAGSSSDQVIVDRASVEIYDPGTGKWTTTWPMNTPRSSSATLLNNGKVLVAGGSGGGGGILASAEIFDPAVPAPSAPLLLTALSPPGGPTAGGTAVTITGSNFASGATVTFGAAAAANVTIKNASTITCIAPAFASGGIVTVTVTNPDGTEDSLDGYDYTDSLQLYGPTTATGTVGVPFSFQTGALNASDFSFQPLPPGLTADTRTGEITGTPTVGGQFVVHVTVTQPPVAFGAFASVNQLDLHLTIANGAGAPVIANTPLMMVGTAGSAVAQYALSATGSVPITFSVQGLPPGLSFDGTYIGGTPTAAGQTNVTLTATNSVGTDTKTLAVNIGSGAPLAVTPISITGQAGSYLFFPLPVSSGPTPKFTITPEIRNGLNAFPSKYENPNQIIKGMPQGPQQYSGKVTAANSAGSITVDLAITIAAPPSNNASISAKLSDAYSTAVVHDSDGGVGIAQKTALNASLTVSLESLDFSALGKDTKVVVGLGDYLFNSTLGAAPSTGIGKIRGKLDLAKGSATFVDVMDISVTNTPHYVEYGSVALKWNAKKKTLLITVSRKIPQSHDVIIDAKPTDNILCQRSYIEAANSSFTEQALVSVQFGNVQAWVATQMSGKSKSKGTNSSTEMIVGTLYTISARGSATAPAVKH
ncbi:MAG: kelch repeat-containing protein [Planctomycetota bacterium]